MRKVAYAAFAAMLLSTSATAAFAADDKAGGGKDAQVEKVEAATATAPVAEQAKTTSHVLSVGGKSIKYKATAGTVTIRNGEGKPSASVFYIAYTADAAPGAKRPVTFLYNGGPGSASLWLTMGSVGPVRVKTGSPGNTAPAPYTLEQNPYSLLDKSDLVFIDAVGAGYSRPLGEAKGKDFYGVDQDVDAFAKAIERWLEINKRWNSPKFLFGESYGTTRSAALVNKLQEDGYDFNGVVLLSSILNYGVRQPGYDRVYTTYLPSYAATAWYHDKLADKPADLPTFLNEVRAWADGPYTAALAKGHNLPDAEREAIAQQLSAYTGLSIDYLKSANLRVELGRFRKELLRDERKIVGRFDSRFEGVDSDAAGEDPESDPSSTAISSAFITTHHDYVQNELGYETDLEYKTRADGANAAWDWGHRFPNGGGNNRRMLAPDTALDLANAMRTNPNLHVLSMNGWYDMATPFFGTEYDLNHMHLDGDRKNNVSFTYYPSGHMAYLSPDVAKQMRVDLERFYNEALAQ
ncbi:S10 family peptidase [Caulobacter sp. 17J80-11]|uniref:S10 family peptidase n=1 Tax=Caulobacter sp. 17J80-11 TaxID=2763502 RepID=UPI0016534954|nr:peptidase S10 [Caulobacter sp. 17J80-11]MBC6983011.1 peptidase S10 [Caulobacter sp. 17J80-11]